MTSPPGRAPTQRASSCLALLLLLAPTPTTWALARLADAEFNLANSIGDMKVTQDEFTLIGRTEGRLRRVHVYEGRVGARVRAPGTHTGGERLAENVWRRVPCLPRLHP